MRADQSGSQREKSGARESHNGVSVHSGALDLGSLSMPYVKAEGASSLNLLRPAAHTQQRSASETLSALRHEMLALVDDNTRPERGFGFGIRPADPLDITELHDHTRGTLEHLEALYAGAVEGVVLNHTQRDIILQANTVLRDFLVSLAEIAVDGTINRSDTSGFLRQCIALGQVLGQIALAVDSARTGMGKRGIDAEIPSEILGALVRRFEHAAE